MSLLSTKSAHAEAVREGQRSPGAAGHTRLVPLVGPAGQTQVSDASIIIANTKIPPGESCVIHSGGSHGDSDGFVGEEADVGLGRRFGANSVYFAQSHAMTIAPRSRAPVLLYLQAGRKNIQKSGNSRRNLPLLTTLKSRLTTAIGSVRFCRILTLPRQTSPLLSVNLKQGGEKMKGKSKRAQCTLEFKREAVRLVKKGQKFGGGSRAVF
jgi:hypothetical protein